MSEDINCVFYSGCYGGETNNNGDIVVTTVKCGDQPRSLTRKQIIFVVDESGSMVETMPSVRASLLVARNALLRLIGNSIDQLSEIDRDRIFTEQCAASIITFSDSAVIKWESAVSYGSQKKNPTKFVQSNNPLFNSQAKTFTKDPQYNTIPFSEAVKNIEAKFSTNMGDGLELAFAQKIQDYATWIILLTDGISNRGSYQTVNSFKSLISNMESNTKIIPLGYSTNFDPDVLSVLGNMTYLESEESIPEVFGSIVAEIVTCYGMNAKITIPTLQSGNPSPDDIIVVEDNINPTNVVAIGSPNMGSMFNERKFIYGLLPWGNVRKSNILQYENLMGQLTYYNIQQNEFITTSFAIRNGGDEVPDDIRDAYFESSKGRVLLAIYRAQKIGKLSESFISSVKDKIADWKHVTAIQHKEEILRILQDRGCENKIKTIAACMSAQTQSAYIFGNRTTSVQKLTSENAVSEYNTTYIRIDTNAVSSIKQ